MTLYNTTNNSPNVVNNHNKSSNNNHNINQIQNQNNSAHENITGEKSAIQHKPVVVSRNKVLSGKGTQIYLNINCN